MGKKITALMDNNFQQSHRTAFITTPEPFKVGDKVFLIDHYWPGIVIADITGTGKTWKISCPTLLDGNLEMTYSSRQMRHATDWDIPTTDEIAAILKLMDD